MDKIKVYDVRAVKADSAFLIDDGKTAILYDTGFAFTGEKMCDNIEKVLNGRELDYVFLTHSHYDHALGSAYATRRWKNVKVVAGKYAAYVFTRPGAKRTMKDLDMKFAQKCGVTDYEYLGEDLRVDIEVSDGDIVHTGDMTFEVIELPGHTKCSVGYYLREHKLLLSTETLGVFNGEGGIVPSFLVGYQMTMDSIKKIKKYEVSSMVLPHYGLIDEKQTKYFMDNTEGCCIEVANFICDYVKKGKENEEIIEEFKRRYRKGHVEKIYPEDAVNLNTSIMIELIKKELM